MSSVFGMNAAEFANNSWSLGEQFRLLCELCHHPLQTMASPIQNILTPKAKKVPISFGITAATIIAAFSSRVRRVFLLIYRLLKALLLYKTGINRVWVQTGLSTERFTEWVDGTASAARDKEHEKIAIKRRRRVAQREVGIRMEALRRHEREKEEKEEEDRKKGTAAAAPACLGFTVRRSVGVDGGKGNGGEEGAQLGMATAVETGTGTGATAGVPGAVGCEKGGQDGMSVKSRGSGRPEEVRGDDNV